jgi:adhesin HecA-like repeat protein
MVGLTANVNPRQAGLNLSNVFSSAGLTLNIVNNLVNQGTISTPGTLNINASGSIVNSALNGAQSSILANVVNLYSGNGSIVNSGLIQAQTALNLQSDAVHNLMVNNTSGTMQALAGAINAIQCPAIRTPPSL